MGKIKKLKAKVKRWKNRFLSVKELNDTYYEEIAKLRKELYSVKDDYEAMIEERDRLFERLYGESFRSDVEKLADMPRVSYLTEKETDAVLKSGNVLTIEGKPVPYGSFEEMLNSIALDYDAQIKDLKFELSELDDRNTAAEGELADTLKKVEILENKLECRTTALEALREEMDKGSGGEAKKIEELEARVKELDGVIQDKFQYIMELEDEKYKLEMKNKSQADYTVPYGSFEELEEMING